MERSTAEKESNFSEWYNEILSSAEIMDVRYPVKGVYVWYPYGYKIRKLVFSILRSLMDEEHEETLFPMLIPRDELMKEKEHIRGFEEQVFWVTRGGSEELDIPLALRPTSETAIYPMFKVWIRSHRDLPLRIYQIVNTFRYETKHTRPLIRLREITSFKEAHTAHSSYEDAEMQIKKAIRIYKNFFDRLAVPYVITRRPEWDKFPGADYTIAFDTLMPDGRTLQIATIHNLGTNFAKTFDIKFEDKEGERRYVCQTCYGISERCIAATISIHGDDHGLVLPPEVAPIQVVIVPIVFSKEGEEEGRGEVEGVCEEVYQRLKGAGVRVFLDKSEERPGAKYYKWERKGVPLRIEIGPRDVREKSCVFVRRDNFVKKNIPLSEVEEAVKQTLDEIYNDIYDMGWKTFLAKIHNFEGGSSDTNETLERIRERVSEGGIISLFLCDDERCGRMIKEATGADVLGEPVLDKSDIEKGRCEICSREGKRVYIARTY
ncbi:MAG: proline--tRNA ligase [Candidatus Methanospirareceae archaeon]